MNNRKSTSPPRLAEKLFTWLAGPAAADDLLGDLVELFNQEVQQRSVLAAKFNFWRRTITLMFSYALRSRRRKQSAHVFSSSSFDLAMLSSYLVIAARSLKRDRFFAFMNVAGLAIGMSISLLLLAILGYVSTYDTFHANRHEIYRVVTRTESTQGTDDWASSPAPLYDRLNGSVSGIKEMVRLQTANISIQHEGKEVMSLRGFYGTPSFLDVFTFPLLKGNPRTSLVKPNSLLLTEAAAAKVFGDLDPLGKTIQLADGTYEVTGILKDHPRNSHLHFEGILSFSSLETAGQNETVASHEAWKEFNGSYLYVLMPASARVSLESYFQSLTDRMYSEPGFSAAFSLQPLDDIVPGPDLRDSAGPSWDLLSMGIFFFLTLLILLPAVGNYAMISISRALRRMKEIGVRKAIGSSKRQVVAQFVMEAVVVSFLALVISFYLFVLIRDEFLSMIVSGESLDLSAKPLMFTLFGAFTLLVGVFSGLVPGLYFARMSPLQALRSKSGSESSKKFSMRKALLVIQFSLALGFIMSVVIVFSQYRKTLQYDFGFKHANMLNVELQGVDPEIFRSEFSRIASVKGVSLTSHIIGTQMPAESVIFSSADIGYEVLRIAVDGHHVENLGLHLIAGRNFETDASVTQNAILVNERFVVELNLGSAVEAIGKVYQLNGREVVVTGVVSDFHYASLREPIRALCLVYDPAQYRTAAIKMDAPDAVEALANMGSVWKTFGGDRRFIAKFYDDQIEEAYDMYYSLIKICGFLGLLAISISCLGLLGMVVFTIQTRVKEIGVRKVMGSTTQALVVLLSWDFVKLMLVAFVIATPLTYLFMVKAFLPMQHSMIPISMTDIVLSLLIILTLGLTTILSQTIKASNANPVDSLRSE